MARDPPPRKLRLQPEGRCRLLPAVEGEESRHGGPEEEEAVPTSLRRPPMDLVRAMVVVAL